MDNNELLINSNVEVLFNFAELTGDKFCSNLLNIHPQILNKGDIYKEFLKLQKEINFYLIYNNKVSVC